MNVISNQAARPVLDAGAGAAAAAIERVAGSDQDFLARFFSMLPPDVARSFSDRQLKAISCAFGTRRWRDHTLDRRWLIPLFGHSYYFVLLAGAERRSRQRRLRDRLLHPLISIGNGMVAALFFAGILISLLVSLYVIKSLLGIDLLPDFSLGVMPFFKQELQMLFG